jgi:quinol monooxygenase YgiN
MLSDFPGRTIVADIRLLHRYKDKKALKEHGESAAFQKFQKGVSEQDLLLAPPTIHVLSRRGGFSSRL